MDDFTRALALETPAGRTPASEITPKATIDLLRSWRRRELDESRARYEDVAPTVPAGRGALHRRLSAALGDWLVYRAVRLAAYGRRRPPDQIVAQLLDAHLLDEEFRS